MRTAILMFHSLGGGKVTRPRLLKRGESRSRIEPRSFCLPAWRKALPLGQTGSQTHRDHESLHYKNVQDFLLFCNVWLPIFLYFSFFNIPKLLWILIYQNYCLSLESTLIKKKFKYYISNGNSFCFLFKTAITFFLWPSWLKVHPEA